MTERVGVWIDYENARRRAAACFQPGVVDTEGYGFKAQPGHFWPLALARLLVARPVAVLPRAGGLRSRRELVRVDVFLGHPDARQRPALAHYVERMTQAWARQGVDVTLLPTRLTQAGAEVEKGIDVSLALSVQDALGNHDLDVVLLVSADNDLLPVVHTLHPRRSYLPAIELAAWRGPTGGTVMRAPAGVLTHILDGDDYREVACDLVRDYGRPAGGTLDDSIGAARRVAGYNVTTLADRFAAAGIAVKLSALRPVEGGHGQDAPLWRPEAATVRRIRFGRDGLIPDLPQRQAVVLTAAPPTAAPAPAPVAEPSCEPAGAAGLRWWRRLWAAIFGRRRRRPNPRVPAPAPSAAAQQAVVLIGSPVPLTASIHAAGSDGAARSEPLAEGVA